MTDQQLRRGVWRAGMLATLCAGAIGLAACGGSGDSSDGASASSSDGGSQELEAARKLVEAATKPPTFEAPGPEFDASGAAGKTVFFDAALMNIDYTKAVTTATKEALTKAGVNLIVTDSQQDPTTATRQIQQAVARKVDAIVVQTVDPKLLKDPLSRAKAAGIPVVMVNTSGPRLPNAEEKAVGIEANFTIDWARQGELQVAAALVEAGGPEKMAVIASPDLEVGRIGLEGVKKGFEQFCPSCEVEYKDVLLSQWTRNLPSLTQNTVVDPNVKVLLPLWDSMTPFMLPSINAAGATKRVKIVTTAGNSTAMKNLSDGGPITVDIGNNQDYQGWALADQLLRVLTDNEPVADPKVPLTIFNTENVKDIDVSQPESTWYGSFSFKDEFRQLWGL
jgi:ribose transport system substrate-binding protein